MLLFNNGFDHNAVAGYLFSNYFHSTPPTDKEIYEIISTNIHNVMNVDGPFEEELVDLLFSNVVNYTTHIKDAIVIDCFYEVKVNLGNGDFMLNFPVIVLQIGDMVC